MALFDSISQAVSGFGVAKDVHKDMLTESEVVTDGQTVEAGKDNLLGEFTIPAQRKYNAGYGDENHPDNQGYIYIDLQTKETTPQQVEGEVLVVITDADSRRRRVVWSQRTEELRGSLTDKQLKEPFPEIPQITATEDDLVKLEVNPDSDWTTNGVGQAESTVHIPVTVEYLGSV